MSDRFSFPQPRVIRVVAPAGPVNEGDLARGMDLLRDQGFTVEVAPHVLRRDGYLAGPDEVRLLDLQDALDDPAVDLLWFARGGYGTTRLLGRLTAERLSRNPKLLVGFSDATALFAWASRLPNVRCLYAPSVQELAREGVCQLSPLWEAIRGEAVSIPGEGPSEPWGPFLITGGCLTLCSVSVGTSWEPEVEGHWLFLEDVGEPLYRIDRMLTHLAQVGWLKGCAGLLLGGFTGLGEGESYDSVVARSRTLLGPLKPIVSGLPVGHLKGKYPLPLGTRALWDRHVLCVERQY